MTSDDMASLAEMALAQGDEEAVELRLHDWLHKNPGDFLIWHWMGLLHRSLDRHVTAIADFETALRHAPGHPGLTHALAHTLLEAGLPSTGLFLEAIRLAPAKSDIRLGLAASRFADGQGERGLSELGALLSANPGWHDGHRKYAQLASMVGQSDHALASIEQALQASPESIELYLLGIELLLEGDCHPAALDWIDRAIAKNVETDSLLWAKATALDELYGTEASADLFIKLGPASNQAQAIRRIRHYLRRGDWGDAVSQIEPWLTREHAENVWPYAALAWRLAGDSRWQWLEDRNELIRIIDFEPDAMNLSAITSGLRTLHDRSGRFLNQSVRHGTQTDGPLFARVDPVLVQTREKLRDAITDFVKMLPANERGHPVLRWPRDRRPRFAGSWSVRLTERGFHSSHNHPQGWLSGVLYLAMPETLIGSEGHLVLGGSPDDLELSIKPLKIVQPRPGRLVIFPSSMWHGTLAFRDGERLTIAFDICRP